MTVKELIEQLEQFDGDTEVKFAYNYGDHWRTKVADDIADVELKGVTYSEYHSMDKIVDEDEQDGKSREVVVIW